MHVNSRHGSIELSSDEKQLIAEILPKGTSAEEAKMVLGILSQLNTNVSGEEDISDQDQVQLTYLQAYLVKQHLKHIMSVA